MRGEINLQPIQKRMILLSLYLFMNVEKLLVARKSYVFIFQQKVIKTKEYNKFSYMKVFLYPLF